MAEMEQLLSDMQWARIGPLLLVHRRAREAVGHGGASRLSQGDPWVLRTGARARPADGISEFCDMRWRRPAEWECADA